MFDHVDRVRGLAAARLHTLGKLGALGEGTIRDRQRVIRRGAAVLLVTHGLSDPLESAGATSTHEAPRALGCEIAIETLAACLPATDVAAVATSWLSASLAHITAVLLQGPGDPVARVISAGPLVIDIPGCVGLRSLEAPNGTIGVLLGLPLGNDRRSVHDILARDPNAPNEPVWLFTAKLLLPEERAWVGQHVLRARELARGFLRDETRHYSLPRRASVLPSIVLG